MIVGIITAIFCALSLGVIALFLAWCGEKFTSFSEQDATPIPPLADNHILSILMAFMIIAITTIGVLYGTSG